MQIKINVQHLSIPQKKLELIEKKVQHLTELAARIKDESSYIRVDLVHEEARRIEDQFECTITIFVPQDTLRAHSRNNTIENAVDDVVTKLRGQIEHYKAKIGHLNDH